MNVSVFICCEPNNNILLHMSGFEKFNGNNCLSYYLKSRAQSFYLINNGVSYYVTSVTE